MSADGFLALLETHDHLDELFALHQEAILTLRWRLAVELLEAYRTLLSMHVNHEEQVLMPLFERASAIANAPVIMFTDQHRKMFAQLDRIKARLDAVQQNGEIRRDAIEVLDLETAFKHLIEHHHGAELNHFYPRLNEVASELETAEIIRRCWKQWNLARANLVSMFARARQELDAATAR